MNTISLKIDGVFSGGGVKAFAFIGVLESLSNHQLSLERVAGTSAGAIIAALVAARYEAVEIKEQLISLHLKGFLDPPTLTRRFSISKWLFLFFKMGLNKGDKLEYWLAKQLAKKGIHTFGDLPDNYLKVIATDLTYERLVVIPDDLPRLYGINPEAFSIAKAVRMSAGFPYFFVPRTLKSTDGQKCLLVDGGLVSNFPLWVFESDHTRQLRPTIGVKLGEPTDQHDPQYISNSFELMQAMFSTMKRAHDTRYISKNQRENIIFVPVSNISPIDLSIDYEQRQTLIKNGLKSSDRFLKKWPN